MNVLLVAVQSLYEDAGRPSYRKISREINSRDDEMPRSLGYQTVRSVIRGDNLRKWSSLECVVRQLATMSIHKPDPEVEVRRFHALWKEAQNGQ